jgi:hypothetical protein
VVGFRGTLKECNQLLVAFRIKNIYNETRWMIEESSREGASQWKS